MSIKVAIEEQNQYLDNLLEAGFQVVNGLFVWYFKINVHQTGPTEYFLPTLEIKNCSVKIDWKNFFDQTVKNDLRCDSSRRRLCNYNPGHNILALFNNLAYVWITTSKMILDI